MESEISTNDFVIKSLKIVHLHLLYQTKKIVCLIPTKP